MFTIYISNYDRSLYISSTPLAHIIGKSSAPTNADFVELKLVITVMAFIINLSMSFKALNERLDKTFSVLAFAWLKSRNSKRSNKTKSLRGVDIL